MKKIDWRNIFSIMLIMVLMLVGCYLIDNEWCYELEMAIVWSVGMLCITELLIAINVKAYLKNIDK